jgi:hypothetical protein
MKLIIDVKEGQEEFLFNLLQSLNILNSIEKIDPPTELVDNNHSTVLNERLEKYRTGNLPTRTWEDLQNELAEKYGL